MSPEVETKPRRDDEATETICVDDEKKLTKVPTNAIEYSINMNVSLSKNERRKMFRKARSFLIAILAISFAVLCFQLRREVRALEIQINNANKNLMALMLKYNKLSNNVDRLWYERQSNRNPTKRSNATKSEATNLAYHFEPSMKIVEKKEEEDRGRSARIEDEKRRDENFLVDEVATEIWSELKRIDRENSRNIDRDRYERAIAGSERRNPETRTILTPNANDKWHRDDANVWNENRTGRYRRDDGRGPLVATFVGAIPEQLDPVLIGPWVRSSGDESRYSFNRFHLVENRTSIEVTANGLYMVSAQIYYFGNPMYYSYWITLSSEGASTTRKIVKCATSSAHTASDASCHTSIVLPMRRGDRLRFEQEEPDRLINLQEGHSYVQIMLLSNESTRRRGG